MNIPDQFMVRPYESCEKCPRPLHSYHILAPDHIWVFKTMSQAILECAVNIPDHYSHIIVLPQAILEYPRSLLPSTILPQAIYESQKNVPGHSWMHSECPRPLLPSHHLAPGHLWVSKRMSQAILVCAVNIPGHYSQGTIFPQGLRNNVPDHSWIS